METEKLYYQDPFLREFTAVVQACEAMKDSWRIVLDRTAFYPEGGGQPADHGCLDAISVMDVHEKNGVVFHTCDGPLEVGASVAGVLDWERRFDHMQQHSGEHIISGILCERFHCDNVGFHMGAETVTIDYNAEISWEQAEEAERLANQVIWQDQPVEVSYPSPEELAALDYRSKKALTGQVRIVTFPGADCCACCGTHVFRAGQVGLVKVLSCQKFREGVRLEILCGRRAAEYLSLIYGQVRTIAQRLSVKPRDAAAAVERLEGELSAAKAAQIRLEETAFEAIARENAGKNDVLLFQPPMKPDSVRRLADTAARRCGGLTAVFAGENGDYAYALVQADGMDISAWVKTMNQTLHGRGGGRNGFAQGSVQAEQTEIEAFLPGREVGFMDYVMVEWDHDLDDEPYLVYSELDGRRMERRKVEFFRNGICFSYGAERGNEGALADAPFPEDVREITGGEEGACIARTISRQLFQEIWNQAQERPDGFMGMFF